MNNFTYAANILAAKVSDALSRHERHDEPDDALRKCIVDALKNNGTVRFCGVGKNYWLALGIAATWKSLGLRADALDPVHAMHGDLGSLQYNDIVIGISKSGSTAELLHCLNYIEQHDIVGYDIWMLQCSKYDNSYMRVELPTIKEVDEDSLVPSASILLTQTYLYALGYNVAVEVVDFCKAKFIKTHPGGAIGASAK